MAKGKPVQNSFSAGEISPQMFGRTDMNKYQNGLEECLNFFVDFHGGVSNRPGTRYVGRTLNQAFEGNVRIRKFQVSSADNYILEFGDQYMRVIRQGGYVTHTPAALTSMTQANPAVFTSAAHGLVDGDRVFLSGAQLEITDSIYIVENATTNTFELKTEDGVTVDGSALGALPGGATYAKLYKLTTPYTDAQIDTLHFTQSVDAMTITHREHPPRELRRIAHDNWVLSEINFSSSISPPGGLTGVASSPTDPVEYLYTVTAVGQDGEESVADSVTRVQGEQGKPFTLTWNAVPGAAYYGVYRTLPGPVSTGVPPGSSFGYIGNAFNTGFVDSNITPDFSKQPPRNQNPFAPGAITYIGVGAGGNGYGDVSIIITDSTGTGARALGYTLGGNVRSVAVISGGKNYTAPTITAGGAGSGALFTYQLGPSTGTYPRTAAYFQQRLVFASSENDPATLWGSRPGQIHNMDVTIPSNSGDAFAFTLSSVEINQIKSLMPMPGGLVIFTGSAIWQLSGSGVNTPVLPTNAVANPQSYHGAGDLIPIAVDYNILYAQASHLVVHELTYNWNAQNYTTMDVSAFSSHLFKRYEQPDPLVAWTYANIPNRLLYAVQESGRLLIMTYMKEQEIAGWSQHTTRGMFRDVETVREGTRDIVYCITQRYINGGWRKSIEQFMPREFPNGAEDAWFLDSAVRLAQPAPQAYLTFTAARGTGVTVTASASVFSSGDVGKVIRAGGGRATIVSYVDGTTVLVDFTRPIKQVIDQSPAEIPQVIRPGAWTMTEPVSTLYGLQHLEGEEITVLADGAVYEKLTVVNGSVTIPNPASQIVAGIPYTCRIKPLIMTTQPPTQGNQKKLSRAVVKVHETRGLKGGINQLTPFKERRPSSADTLDLVTQEIELIPDAMYDTLGQMVFEQQYPLPATILSIAYDADFS